MLLVSIPVLSPDTKAGTGGQGGDGEAGGTGQSTGQARWRCLMGSLWSPALRSTDEWHCEPNPALDAPTYRLVCTGISLGDAGFYSGKAATLITFSFSIYLTGTQIAHQGDPGRFCARSGLQWVNLTGLIYGASWL